MSFNFDCVLCCADENTVLGVIAQAQFFPPLRCSVYKQQDSGAPLQLLIMYFLGHMPGNLILFLHHKLQNN